MSRLLVCIFSFAATAAVAVRVQVHQHELTNSTEEEGDLCGKSLIISYKQSEHDYDKEGLWILSPGDWSEAVIVEKKADDGCTRTYTASCTKGMIVTKTCNETTIVMDYRCLGSGVGDCSVFYPNSRGTDLQIKKGETEMTVHDPKEGVVTMREGRVSWSVRDMPNTGGLELTEISKGPGATTWSAASGCYCCKHSYPILHSPFCYLSSANTVPRVAWKVQDGTQECMNAWQFIGEDDVAMLVPKFIYSILDIFTLGITSNSACAIACASRNTAKFPEHKYYYKKSAISDSSCT